MKKGFTTFLSALKANTPPCKKGLSSLRFLSIFLILFLAVGNAWGQETVFKCKLNGDVLQERGDGVIGDFFTFAFSSGSYSWKKASDLGGGCVYDGVTYTSAMKFDSKPTLSFTTTETSTVVVVMSSKKNATKAPKLDGTAMSTTSEDIDGAKVWTKTDVGAGNHSIKYNGEIWIYCVYVIYPNSNSYIVTYNANDGSGTMVPTTNEIVECSFTYEGKDFVEWNTKADGTGESYAPGDNATKDLDLYAIWTDHVAKYTLVYRVDGVEVGNELVNVSGTPVGIADPTKDCYTFAGWDPALNTVSGSDGDEVVVNATWTPVYSTSATLISDDVVSGKPNVNTVFAASNIVSSITFASGNYEFTSNETKKGYYGYKDKQSGDNMKILVQQGKQVQVLFGNLGSDPTITANGVAQSLDASRATGDNAENTFTYTASAADALISITMGSGTNTLKKVDIVQLYTATRVDAKSDGAGSDPNVAETTLPTPTAVSGWTFTGWITNQDVKDGDETKTAETILPAGTYTLLANTTFTAQWIEVTGTYDIMYVSDHGTAPTAENAASVVLAEITGVDSWAHKGWTADVDVTVDAATVNAGDLIENGKTVILAGDVTFTAVWKKIFTVTFESKGGSSVDPVDVEDGASLDAAPDDPTKTDYVFQGWSETDGGAVVADITALSITGDKTLYAIWALDVQVSEIVFSNSFKGWIHDSQVEVFYMEGESAPTITSYAGENLKAEGGVVISGDKIIATGTDNSKIEFALTMTAVAPLDAAGAQTFDGTEGYVKTRHAWTSERKWKMSKDGTDGRVARGETSMYIFLGAAESVTLDWGAQKVTDDVAVYVNGKFVKNIGKNNNSAIPLTGGNNMVALYSLQTSGDIWLNGLSVVAYVPTTGVALQEGDDPISSKTIWESTNFTLTATVTPDNASDKTITWTSSDDAIATVVDGVVTGVAANATPATITATTVDGVSATCVVTVTTAPAPSAAPTITTQPADANYYEGATIAALEVVATGSGDLSYQWYLGSDEIDGATTATYTPTVSAIGSYVYHCVVTNTEAGHLPTSLASNNATITIAEDPAAIKLLDGEGEINTTNFTTGVTKGTVTISEVSHNCAVFGSTGGSIVGLTGLNKVVAYNATTTQTKVKFVLYNENNSPKEMYLQKVLEGATEAVTETIAVPSKTYHETQYYEYNSSDLRSFYVTVNSTSIKILQVKVIETGTILKRAGQVGYDLNLNKGRVFGAQGVEIAFEGLTFAPSSNAKVLNSTELPIKTPLSFTIATPLTLAVTASAAKYYVSQNAEEDGTTATAVTETGTKEFNLGTTGTWYIVPSTSSTVKLTNIAFSAPKCEEPIVTDMANSELCEGAAYDDLVVSASVTDGGTLHYQWYKHPAEGDDEAVGTDAATYTPAADGQYYVIVTNKLADHSDNSKASNMVTVEHFASAEILSAPENVRMDAGQAATLTVEASGKNLTYQWYTCDDAAGTNPEEVVGATNASLEVTVPEGVQYYKVVVSSDCGAPAEAVALVEEWTELPQAYVTGSRTWDWAAESMDTIKTVSGSTEYLMANVSSAVSNNEYFRSDMLYITANYANRGPSDKFFQGTKIRFNTTVDGLVRVYFRGTGNSEEIRLTINGEEASTHMGGFVWSNYIEVPAGEVTILGTNTADPAKLTRIQKIEFLALGYTRDVNVGELATVCLPNACVARDVEVYELVGKEPQYGKIVFDEILSGELMAGKPYLLRVTNPKAKFYYTVDAPAAEPNNSGAMKGTFEYKELTELTNIYYFAQKALWSCVDLTKLTVPANRAYVNMAEMPDASTSNPAPGVRRVTLGVNGQNVTTGVDQVQGDEVPTKMIINSQLYILRGEKMYDATGKLVK